MVGYLLVIVEVRPASGALQLVVLPVLLRGVPGKLKGTPPEPEPTFWL